MRLGGRGGIAGGDFDAVGEKGIRMILGVCVWCDLDRQCIWLGVAIVRLPGVRGRLWAGVVAGRHGEDVASGAMVVAEGHVGEKQRTIHKRQHERVVGSPRAKPKKRVGATKRPCTSEGQRSRIGCQDRMPA